MSTPHRIYPHGEPEQVAEGLWQLRGSLPFPIPRYMTIWRMPSGGLLLYSVIALDEAGLAKLEALGKPEIMVVPHLMHCMDAPFYKARYPQLKVVALPDAAAKIAPAVVTDGGPDAILPALGLRCFVVPGLKLGEIAVEIPLKEGGHALQLTDMISNGRARSFMIRLLGPPGGAPGMARIVRWRQVADKRSVGRFLRERAAAEPRILLITHGPAMKDEARGVLERTASALGA